MNSLLISLASKQISCLRNCDKTQTNICSNCIFKLNVIVLNFWFLNLKDSVRLELNLRIIYCLQPVISLISVLFSLYCYEIDEAKMLNTHQDFRFEWEQNYIVDALSKLKMSIAFGIWIVELYPSCRIDLVNHLHWRKINWKKMATKAAKVALPGFMVGHGAKNTMAFSIKGLNQF